MPLTFNHIPLVAPRTRVSLVVRIPLNMVCPLLTATAHSSLEMVTTIHSLPPETLRLILASIDPFYPQIAADLTKSSYSQRYTNLRSAALVCSAWRPMVQEQLWRDVCLRDGRAMDAFPRVGGLFPVSRMIIEVRADGVARCLEGILSGVQGVQDLALIDPWSRTLVPQTVDLECMNGVGYKSESGARSLERELTTCIL